MSGYTNCACRDCMEIAFDGGFCHECEEAGCEDTHGGDGECLGEHSYGRDEYVATDKSTYRPPAQPTASFFEDDEEIKVKR